jgi:uncharacterized damage-inducible protein DinB
MIQLETMHVLYCYNDWANDQLLLACGQLDDEKLDRPFDVGFGSLRATMMHILIGEETFLLRAQGQVEARWGDENETVLVSRMKERFDDTRHRREMFFMTLANTEMSERRVYRDSFGSLYATTLGDLIVQVCTHSMHHRAQVVNMFRRVGANAPELDYIYWTRKHEPEAKD